MRLIATLALCLALASSCDAAYTPDLTPSLSPGLAPEAPDTPGRLMEQSNFHTRTDVLQHGRAPATAMHEVVFARKQNNMDLLELLLERVSDPLSEQYGQHLTRAEVTAMTSNPTAVTQIRLFLTKHDIQLLKVSPHEDYFTTLAPVALWEECLNATFYEFSHPAYDSRVLRAHSYYLPAGLAPHVVLFNTVQLPDYYDLGQSPKPMTPTHNPHASEHSDPHPYSRSVQGAQAVNGDATTPDMDITSLIMETPTTPSPKRSYGFSTQAKGYVEPSLLNKVYNIPSNTGTKATSQAIYAILEQSFSPSDLKTFQDYFSLPREAIDSSVGGYVSNSACADDVNNCIEANLDVQYIMAVAQNVSTVFYYWTGSDVWLSWIETVAAMEDPPDVFSISYGSYESTIPSSYLSAFNTEAIKLGVLGTTLLAASGDDGVGGFLVRSGTLSCGYYAMFPASCPYVTSVGGTMGPEYGDDETACQSDAGSSITTGGGFSQSYSIPSWQRSAVSKYLSAAVGSAINPEEGYSTGKRGYPDISALANKYPVVANGQLYTVSGTSASSPVIAGMVSLVNAARRSQGNSTVGFLNPALYALSDSFANDITVGDNKCLASGYGCCSQGFYASSGWDPVTGLGSIDFQKFQTALLNIRYNGNKIVAPPPTAEPTRYAGRYGWGVVDGYQYSSCNQGGNDNVVIQKGLPLGNCMVQYDDQQQGNSSIKFTCNQQQGILSLKYYSDLTCSSDAYLSAGVIPLGCQRSSDSVYGSLMYRCVTPNDLPLPRGTFVVQKVYESFGQCAYTAMAGYDAWKSGHCFTRPSASTSFRIEANTETYFNSTTCSGQVLSSRTLPQVCIPMSQDRAEESDFLRVGNSVYYDTAVTHASSAGIFGTLTEEEVVLIIVPAAILLLLGMLLLARYLIWGYCCWPRTQENTPLVID